MRPFLLFLIFFSILLAEFFCTTKKALADDVLSFYVSGNVLAPPTWQTAAGADLTAMAFNFSSRLADANATANVDSSVFLARLVNAASYPTTVLLSRPTGCGIGPAVVTDSHVQFVVNGTATTANGALTIPSSGTQNFVLRFAAVGGYGNKAGTVSCGQAGALTYSY